MTDPRPRVVEGDGFVISGVRCSECDHPMAVPTMSCIRCRGAVTAATFGPGGQVWASTVVRIAVGDRTPPYALAYVDLDDGPRVLAHLSDPEAEPPNVGSLVRLVEPRDGDVVVEVLP